MKKGRGRPKKKHPPEGKHQSMKSLTKNHEKFMKTRKFAAAVAANENPEAKEDLENLLQKAAKRHQA